MKLTQKLKTSVNRFNCILILLSSLLLPVPTRAGDLVVGVGGYYPVPLGYVYNTLETLFGAQADAWMEVGFLNPDYMALHFTAGYDAYRVRNQAINVGFLNVLGGLQFHHGNYGHEFMPFISVDIGAAYESMNFSGYTNTSTNAAITFVSQVAPGFDLPFAGKFGIAAQLPIRVVVSPRSFLTWNAIVSLRYAL